jgi:hypothetical protein
MIDPDDFDIEQYLRATEGCSPGGMAGRSDPWRPRRRSPPEVLRMMGTAADTGALVVLTRAVVAVRAPAEMTHGLTRRQHQHRRRTKANLFDNERLHR